LSRLRDQASNLIGSDRRLDLPEQVFSQVKRQTKIGFILQFRSIDLRATVVEISTPSESLRSSFNVHSIPAPRDQINLGLPTKSCSTPNFFPVSI